MNYIGSKHSLLAEIRKVLAAHGLDGRGGTFLDAFAGTTVVGQLAKSLGFATISNDIQCYSFVLQQAFLVQEGPPPFRALLPEIPGEESGQAASFLARSRSFGFARDQARAWLRPDTPLVRVLAHLDGLPGRDGAFVDAYCEGGAAGRNYFSAENGRRCQAIRDRIEDWRAAGAITEGERHVLLASLLETMDCVANTASVYGAYLKHLKRSAGQPFCLKIPALARGPVPAQHLAFNLDAAALPGALGGRRSDVLYLDPPYNQRQYCSNYHILETIARWDLHAFLPRGKTGLRPDGEQTSRFCGRQSAAVALADLVARLDAQHVILSYSNEGLIPEATLREILGRGADKTDFRAVEYRRFRADLDGPSRSYRGDAVREFLFYVRRPGARSACSAYQGTVSARPSRSETRGR